ncbi:MAG: 16S rRNA (cytidine(1402)-2'-O)-methyltransferase [Firmicutes bacterium]|nr:16S rRNA (cytidine(1402)-2'-O)-methyltransferase [Bacillota bacterium]
MTQSCGELFICATPIGNLEDITLRALRVLREADLIAAEDTRRTRQLLTHFDIHTPLLSYHQHNAAGRIPELIRRLKSGESIAVVSDAGTPGISDPGQELIQAAIQEGLPVVPVPGPSAVITALVAAGFDTSAFVFGGFIPRGRREKREAMERVAREPRTTVLYEAPHRLRDTLRLCAELMPQRPMAVCREMTKVHEEIVRGNPAFLLEHFEENNPRGEFVLVFSAVDESSIPADAEGAGEGLTIEERLAELLEQGYDKKAAIKTVARERGVPRREVYDAAIDLPASPMRKP